MSEIFDITIVGGGPVGLFAAFYAHMRQAKVNLIDSLPQLGGQPAILYPEKKILDVPGFTNLTGEELVERLIDQVKTFETSIHLNETVLDIEKKDELFTLTTSKGKHISKAILIAMGGGAFKPRPLELENVDQFENIHYHVSNINQYAGQNIVVLGGGDSAVEEAIYLTKFARKVTIIHRRDALRAAKSIQEKAFANDKIEFMWDSVVEEVSGDEILTKMLVKNVKTGEITTIEADEEDGLFGLFGFIGLIPNTEIFADSKLNMENGYIVTDEDMHTNIEGVYAAGDVRKKSLRQVVTAAADGAIASSQVEHYLA